MRIILVLLAGWNICVCACTCVWLSLFKTHIKDLWYTAYNVRHPKVSTWHCVFVSLWLLWPNTMNKTTERRKGLFGADSSGGLERCGAVAKSGGGWRVSRTAAETLHLEPQTGSKGRTPKTAHSFWNFKVQHQQHTFSSKTTPPKPPQNRDSNQESNIQMSETVGCIYYSNHHILILENYTIMYVIMYKQDVHKGINYATGKDFIHG